MNRRSIAKCFGTLLTLAVLSLLPSPLQAAPLDDRIPADAIYYAGWQGADTLAPQYETSNLKGIIDSSTLPDFITSKIAQLKEKALADKPEIAADIDAGNDSLKILWRHPAAFYFGPMEFTDAEKQIPKFHIALLSQAGPDAKTLADILNKELAAHPLPPDAPKLTVEQDGDFVIIAFGQSTAADFKLTGKKLNTLPAYTDALSHVDSDGALTMYVNGKAALDTLKDGFAKVRDVPHDVRPLIPLFIDSFGLNSITTLTYSGKFDNKAWRELGFVGIDGPRTGLVALADAAPISDATLALVPQNAATMIVGRIDLIKVLALVRDIAAKINPDALKTVNNGLTSASQEVGFDIEKDLINTLGDEWAFFRAPTDAPALSFNLVHKPKDAATLTTTLATIEDLINNKSNGRVVVEKIDGPAGSKISTLRLPQFAIAWAIHNGTFYLSNADGASIGIQQVENKSPSITTNPSYVAIMAALPQQKATSISYSEPAKIYPEIHRAVLSIIPLLRMQGISIPSDALPDIEKSAPFMTPGATISWTDAKGFYSASITAFPGAALLSGQQSTSSTMAVGLVAPAILLPSLGRARELSNRTYALANARGIIASANVWAVDHDDKFPDHLGRLIVSDQITPRQLLTKRTNATPLEMTDDLKNLAHADFNAFAQKVDEHCDFVYIGKNMKSDADSGVAVLYEKPAPTVTDGIVIAFQDAHAEFVRWNRVSSVFVATNVYLKKNNLPEIDVDAALQNAPSQAHVISPPPAMP